MLPNVKVRVDFTFVTGVTKMNFTRNSLFVKHLRALT